MTADPLAPAPQRRRDTEHRLTHDIDVSVASAWADGAPYLVPLSFAWEGEALLVATPTDSPTGRNLAATRTVRLGLGHTREVSVIGGEVEVLEIDALPQQRGYRFAARTAFDRVRWPRRTARSVFPRTASRLGAR
jgi:nitroimidazol reductase NimA-like FMN-containing flavoprotein (pyridoxamine 5'-phosphate oxidase superfamily)